MKPETDEVIHFLTQAVDTGCIWGLYAKEGWAQCASDQYNDSLVIPFWSQPELVESHKNHEWANYDITPIALEEFLDDWLTGMHSDQLLVGINWNEGLEGEEWEPLDLLEVFESTLK